MKIVKIVELERQFNVTELLSSFACFSIIQSIKCAKKIKKEKRLFENNFLQLVGKIYSWRNIKSNFLLNFM